MKISYYLFIICLLLIQSCHHSKDVTAEPVVKNVKLGEAASYNAQLGLAYLKQGDRSRAKHKLILALSQAPNSPAVNASMAYFMEKSGDIDNATLYYKKAIASAPKSGAQLNNYGAFLCRQGQYKLADDYFLKAVNDIEYEHTAGAYENAGLCAMAIPDTVKATMYFKKALEQDPAQEQSLYELVNLDVKQGRFEEALVLLQQYPNLSLQDKTLLAMAADVAHKAGKTELEADYRVRLHRFSEKTGEENEYNNTNG